LKILNASSNRIDSLDLPGVTRSVVERLYLTNNRLTEEKLNMLGLLLHVRVLHLSYNDLHFFPDE
jgi:hypothetical protein